jgi:hypothetical protein
MGTFNRTTRILIATVTLAWSVGGCIAVGGNEHFNQPTLGRQLQDLKVARDTGAMSDGEYQHAKDKLIAGDYHRKR